MSTVSRTLRINAPTDKVWETIRSFTRVEDYLPDWIAHSVVEGSGVGAERVCTLQDGTQVKEKLLALDEEAKTIRYTAFNPPLPVTDLVSTAKVSDAGDGGCEVEWSGMFEPNGVSEEEAVEMMGEAYAMGLEGLRKLHAG